MTARANETIKKISNIIYGKVVGRILLNPYAIKKDAETTLTIGKMTFRRYL